MTGFSTRSWLIAVSLFLAAMVGAPAVAQPAEPPTPASGRELTVATHEAAPFAIKGADGQWHGLAIDLWRNVAQDMGVKYRIVETDLNGMTQGVADGKYDLSVGALTVTPGREKVVDFSQPYYTTGFGIVTRKAPANWFILMSNFFSWGFLQAVALLAGLLLIVGVLFWLAERRTNSEEFGEQPLRGIGSGFWFSAVTMTTVGYGDKAPRTPAGKAIALVWMFAAILIISTFTGMIASSLTEGRLAGRISGPDDLDKVTVGSIGGSAAQDWLNDRGVGFRQYPTIAAGLKAVADEKIDAFVYDRPLLVWNLKQGDAPDGLTLVPGTFGRQDYGFAMAQGDKRREPINVALLTRIGSNEWADQLKSVLGRE